MKGKARRLLSWVCVLALCMSLLPMTALAATIKRKVMSFQSPTSSRHTASTTKIRLKYVSRFSRTICLSDLVGEATDRLSQPASANALRTFSA